MISTFSVLFKNSDHSKTMTSFYYVFFKKINILSLTFRSTIHQKFIFVYNE